MNHTIILIKNLKIEKNVIKVENHTTLLISLVGYFLQKTANGMLQSIKYVKYFSQFISSFNILLLSIFLSITKIAMFVKNNKVHI